MERFATLDSLADAIDSFLKEHGGIKADYDPELDEPEERWNSPDASDLEMISKTIRAGRGILHYPHSDWNHGGYRPGNSADGRAKHDHILSEIRRLKP
jgi:hypothetical protein